MTNRFALLLLLVFVNPLSFAQVHRADGGMGGALIVPYWTTAKNNDTIFLIRNESDSATAAKVRMLDEDGGLLVSFNLYLDARAVWTSATSVFDGSPGLLMLDVGCVLPPNIGGVPADSLEAIPLDRPRGSIEIIEMASATEASDLVSSGQWADCEVLADAFESGDWSGDPNAGLAAPAQRLSASANIINVQVGGMDFIPATALRGFSDIAQHTAPDLAAPDLADAHDNDSPAGGTRSLVCVEGGCRTDEWDLPIKAVAAVLTVSSMRVDYSVSDNVGGKFDWMIHRPLERYEDEGAGFATDTLPMITLRLRDGTTPEPGDYCIPEQPSCGPHADFPLDRGLIQQNLAFNAGATPVGSVIESAVLGHPTIVRAGFALGYPSTSTLDEGSAEVWFDETAEDGQLLVAEDGTVFIGEPVISFAVQQHTNGTLVDSQGQHVIGNYRGTQVPRRVLRLESAD